MSYQWAQSCTASRGEIVGGRQQEMARPRSRSRQVQPLVAGRTSGRSRRGGWQRRRPPTLRRPRWSHTHGEAGVGWSAASPGRTCRTGSTLGRPAGAGLAIYLTEKYYYHFDVAVAYIYYKCCEEYQYLGPIASLSKIKMTVLDISQVHCVILLDLSGEYESYMFLENLWSKQQVKQCFHLLLHPTWQPSDIFRMAPVKTIYVNMSAINFRKNIIICKPKHAFLYSFSTCLTKTTYRVSLSLII